MSRPDPEFAREPFPMPQLPPVAALAEHQHLVVNPFLAVAGLTVLIWLIVCVVRSRWEPLALLPLALLAILPTLVHYHCLDCGATGVYRRWKLHACPKVINRTLRNRTGWLHWPSARLQFVVWMYVLGGFGLLVALLGFGTMLLLIRQR